MRRIFAKKPQSATIDGAKFPAQNPLMANRKKKLSPEQMREYIHSLRGKFKLDTGGKPFAEWWAEYKREEIELEERKFRRFAAMARKRT